MGKCQDGICVRRGMPWLCVTCWMPHLSRKTCLQGLCNFRQVLEKDKFLKAGSVAGSLRLDGFALLLSWSLGRLECRSKALASIIPFFNVFHWFLKRLLEVTEAGAGQLDSFGPLELRLQQWLSPLKSMVGNRAHIDLTCGHCDLYSSTIYIFITLYIYIYMTIYICIYTHIAR